ncbi:uncharacterized protein LOC114741299 [Neltuma alba]|uniref:uncharacterized protein LOC114741299 n=1 Tax=Neltuma alba TaxID=207710 RepID=UPI0010A4B9F5|nr:uncharacterized protein LOC114741299 [Prosopis alba]
MRQPLSLQNISQMTLLGCSKLKSLFSVSIATTIMLEELYVEDCEELKHIITNEAEDDDTHLNCTSIFPKLQSLCVWKCNKLEFIFPSTLSGGLQKLKSIFISGAHELKYLFGKYGDEDCQSHENENNEPHIHLPALESLYLDDVPNMMSISIKKHQPECPSLQIVEAPKEIKKHMEDVRSERANESEIQEIVNVEIPLLTPSVGFQHVLNFHNLKGITIKGNQKLKILFSVSACRNLSQLSQLQVWNCEELVNVVEDDSNNHHHDMNYSSIFPKLEDISIGNCNKLEFIFPLSLFGTLQKLKSLSIWKAAELKYIFGKYDDGDHLSNTIHLPALETLELVDVPKLINNIGAKKYHLNFPPLRSNVLRTGPDRTVEPDLMKIIKDVQKLTEFWVRHSKIEEVLNLEGVESEGGVITLSLEKMWLDDLSELRHICRGPKYILSLANLEELNIIACKMLRAVFCVSILKSLPQLSSLLITDCDELVNIIEESDRDHLHQLCFPKLEKIDIKCCHSLKFLFSISTCEMFPKLKVLRIEEASELEQIFICKQDNMEKMEKMGEVFPKLSKKLIKSKKSLKMGIQKIKQQQVFCQNL